MDNHPSVDSAGRLAPIAALVETAKSSGDVAELLRVLPPIEPWTEENERRKRSLGPSVQGGGNVVVWHDTALFHVQSPRPPVLSVDGGPPVTMRQVTGTSEWVGVTTIQTGRLHSYTCEIDNGWS